MGEIFMSHVREFTTKIEVRNPDDVKRAIDKLVAEGKVKNTDIIRGYQGMTEKPMGIGLTFEGLPYDLDVRVKDHKLLLHFGDVYGHARDYQKIRTMVENAIKNEVLASAWTEFGEINGFGIQQTADTSTVIEFELESMYGGM